MYTATIHHNFRDSISTGNRVLLTDIKKEGKLWRTHSWIDADEVWDFIPKTNRYKNIIQFSAKCKEYINRHTNVKQLKLIDITNITKLK